MFCKLNSNKQKEQTWNCEMGENLNFPVKLPKIFPSYVLRPVLTFLELF